MPQSSMVLLLFLQLYNWIEVISFIYYSKDVEHPFKKKEVERKSNLTSSLRHPFSRSSTLSRRGQRSFLLKEKSKQQASIARDPGDEHVLLKTKTDAIDRKKSASSHKTDVTSPEGVVTPVHAEDVSSELMSVKTTEWPGSGKLDVADKTSSPVSGLPERHSNVSLKNKRKGGFVPDVLRNPSKYPFSSPTNNESVGFDSTCQSIEVSAVGRTLCKKMETS